MDQPGQPPVQTDKQVIESLRGEVMYLRHQLTVAAQRPRTTPWYVTVLAVIGGISVLGWIGVTCTALNVVGHRSAVPPRAAGSYSSTPPPAPPPVEAKPAVESALDFSGTGATGTQLFTLNPGLVQAAYSHSGEGSFAIWLIDGQGNNVELIVNEIGSVSGSKAFGIDRAGQYILSIDADGPWTVSLK